MNRFVMKVSLVLVVLALGGCAGEEPDPIEMEPTFDPELCRATVLQPDLVSQGPDGAPLDQRVWFGRGVDPATGAPTVPAGAIVSTTYLQLQTTPEAGQAFGEMIGPVIGTLMASPGLVAASLAGSDACGVVRTLAVWESEEAMYEFVGSDAHAIAMVRTAEVSRGGSITMHWIASAATDATWEAAAQRLVSHEGPVY